MKLSWIIVLLMCSAVADAQGMAIQNKSVKVIVQWSAADKVMMCKVYNMNKCDSYLQVEFGPGNRFIFPVAVKYNDYEQVAFGKNAVLKFRNLTACTGGTSDWLIVKTQTHDTNR